MGHKIIEMFEKVDLSTDGHCSRVGAIALEIAKHMGVKDHKLEFLVIAATLHDIGKILMPKLNIPENGQPTKEQWQIIREHTIDGYNILKSMKETEAFAEAARSHHEALNGTGYPRSLNEDAINKETKIISVADVFDAILSDRGPFNPAHSISQTIQIMKQLIAKGKLAPLPFEILLMFIQKEGLNDDNIRDSLNLKAKRVKSLILSYFS